MSQLTQIQRAVIEEVSDEPVNRGIIRRIVKVKDESFDVNHQAFDAQIDILTDMGLIQQDGSDRILLTEEGQYLYSSIFEDEE